MEELLTLARDLPRRSVAPGEVLVADGTSPSALFVLLDGALRIEKRGVTIATVAEPGTCVGEMSLLLGIPATADVLATDPSVVAVVDDASARIERESGLGVALARLLATRLHVMTGYLVDIKEQYGDHEGGLGMVDTVLGSLMRGPGARSELGSDRDPDPEY
jgi:CRP-like cAMP-binding protein